MDEDENERLPGASGALSLEIEHSIEVKFIIEAVAALQDVLFPYSPRPCCEHRKCHYLFASKYR